MAELVLKTPPASRPPVPARGLIQVRAIPANSLLLGMYHGDIARPPVVLDKNPRSRDSTLSCARRPPLRQRTE
jgi:hypothetical protein